MTQLKIELMADMSDIDRYLELYTLLLDVKLKDKIDTLQAIDGCNEEKLAAIMELHEQMESGKVFLASLYNLVYDVSMIQEQEEPNQIELDFGS